MNDGFEQSCRWCGEKDRIPNIDDKWESYECGECKDAMDGLTEGGQMLVLTLLRRVQALESKKS